LRDQRRVVTYNYEEPVFKVPLVGPAVVDLALIENGVGITEFDGTDDIALVGIGCRFPGGSDSAELFWQHLCEGQDAISRTPSDRWDAEALDVDERIRRPVRQGGFLHDVALFDAHAFGISRREAREMDPQQRLLAEVTWEALADAGIQPASLAGSGTGVFLGISNSDYGKLRCERLAGIDAFSGTGNALSIAANRLSYLLDARGPSMTVDTACSSSLVALHQARVSMLRGEADAAIVAGVNLILSPALAINFARAGVMAADGRCKTFDAGADGYVRGEGVGVVVLKSLRAARRDGDRVYALLSGSAVNQDGRTNGLMAPNPAAQVDVVRAAQASGGIRPEEVGYVELHGTGTLVGDAIEAGALGEIFAPARSAHDPCAVGSVKTNIGHLESAAGIAGLVKTALMIYHGMMPASLHHHETSPRIDLVAQRLSVVDELTSWPGRECGRIAGISSFGFGGTNAHVVLRSAPEPDEHQPLPSPGAQLLVASARSSESLAQVLRGHIDRIQGLNHQELAEYCAAAALRQEHCSHRVAVVGRDVETLVSKLQGLLDGDDPLGQHTPHREDGTVLVFPGQGKRWWPLGSELFERWPVFACAVDECDRALDCQVDWSLRELLEMGGDDHELFHDPSVVQPVTTAVQIALATLWRSWGVEPDFVVGHSHGEIAAAQVSGALEIHDAIRISHQRGLAIRETIGQGLMAVVGLRRDQAEQVVARVGTDLVAVAALNGPETTVLSGAPEAIRGIAETLDRAGVFAQVIETVDFASHSPQMGGPSVALGAAVADLCPSIPSVRMISTVTGKLVDEPLGADYWARNLRSMVQFTVGLDLALDEGAGRFIEVAGHPAVKGAIQEVVDARGSGALVVKSLHNAAGRAEAMLTNLATLYLAGTEVDWSGVFPTGAPKIDLPAIPWEHQRYWLADIAAQKTGDQPTSQDEFDAAVWQAVESSDVAALAGLLGADDASGRSEINRALSTLSVWAQRKQVRAEAEDKRYEVFWKPMALDGRAVMRFSVVLLPEGWAAERVVRSVVETLGGEPLVELVEVPANATRESLIDLLDPVLTSLADGPLISLLGLIEEPLPEQSGLALGLAQTHLLAQALDDLDAECATWLITSGAISTQPSDRLDSPIQAMIWGLGRVVGLEFPGRWGGLVDLDEEFVNAGRGTEVLRQLLGKPSDEDQVALRGGRMQVRRIRKCLPTRATTSPWVPGGTILITGATGQLGTSLARHLARRGAPHLVLVSRRGEAIPSTVELAEELRQGGSRVDVVACDVTDREALGRVLADLEAAGTPVSSVFHLAGDVSLVSPLPDTSVEQVARVVAAKVTGAANLDALLPDKLDHFVLYSSITGVWGSAQQSGYSAGNAYLDALAQCRRSRGSVATAVAWGPWEGSGHASHKEMMARRGLLMLDESTALAGLDIALERKDVNVVLTEMDWDLFSTAYTAARPRPFLDELVGPVARMIDEPETSEPQEEELLRRLEEAEPARRMAVLEEACTEVVARSLRVELGEIDPEAPLTDLGVDSLIGLEIRAALHKLTGCPLPATLVWRRPTVTGITEFIAEQLGMSFDSGRAPQFSVEEPVTEQISELVDQGALDELDDDEVEQLLRARLAEFE